MKYLFGLGNPGAQYELTRHNVGFLFLDYLLEEYSHTRITDNPNYISYTLKINKQDIKLIYPLRYMNLSGEIVKHFVNEKQLSQDDFIVIYDDFHLPLGKIRLRPKGSAAGHNGIKNITAMIHTDEFLRIRIGIGKPIGSIIDYVLGEFSDEDLTKLPMVFKHIEESLKVWLEFDFKRAMDLFNGKDALNND